MSKQTRDNIISALVIALMIAVILCLLTGCKSGAIANPIPAIQTTAQAAQQANDSTVESIDAAEEAWKAGNGDEAAAFVLRAKASAIAAGATINRLLDQLADAKTDFDAVAAQAEKYKGKWERVQDDWLGPRTWRVIWWTVGISSIIAIALFFLGRGAMFGPAIASMISVAFHAAAAIATCGFSLLVKFFQWVGQEGKDRQAAKAVAAQHGGQQ